MCGISVPDRGYNGIADRWGKTRDRQDCQRISGKLRRKSMAVLSVPRLAEELRHEVGEVIPPVAPHVARFRGGEGVLDVVFGQHIVERLGSRTPSPPLKRATCG